MLRKLLILGLLPAVLLLGVACGGDDEDDGDNGGGDPTATAAATEAPGDDPTEEPTEEPTEAPTEEPMDDESVLSATDGLTCTGDWTNTTFGSTGSFEAVFAVDEGDLTGTVTIRLGGRVFGAEPSDDPIILPMVVVADTVGVQAGSARLGVVNLIFNGDGTVKEGVFDSPPALGTGSSVVLEDFTFDGSELTATLQIDFGDGSGATSAIESTCA